MSSHLLTHELKNIAFINAHIHAHIHAYAHQCLNTTIVFSVCVISHRQSADTLGFWLMQGMFLLLRKRVCMSDWDAEKEKKKAVKKNYRKRKWVRLTKRRIFQHTVDANNTQHWKWVKERTYHLRFIVQRARIWNWIQTLILLLERLQIALSFVTVTGSVAYIQ